jgi:hypothetical protein
MFVNVVDYTRGVPPNAGSTRQTIVPAVNRTGLPPLTPITRPYQTKSGSGIPPRAAVGPPPANQTTPINAHHRAEADGRRPSQKL